MSIIDRAPNIMRLAQRLRQYGRLSMGRVLGTVADTNGQYKFYIDLIERSLFMRAEINALSNLLVKKKIFTHAEWQETYERELDQYDRDLAGLWPEAKVAHDGKSYTLDAVLFAARMKRENWPQ